METAKILVFSRSSNITIASSMEGVMGPWIGREGRFYTYIHSSPDGVPFYIGKGSLYRAFRVKHSRNRIHQAFVFAYGADNIRVSLIECETDEEARETERKLIAEYSLTHRLANLSTGGQGASGYKHTLDARRNMSASRTGVKWSDERRERHRTFLVGRVQTQATRDKLSMKWTPERKEALRIALLEGRHAICAPGVRGSGGAKLKGRKHPEGYSNRRGKVWVHKGALAPQIVSLDVAVTLMAEGWMRGLGGGRGGGGYRRAGKIN